MTLVFKHKCKACNTEPTSAINFAENKIMLHCDKCRVTEYVSLPNKEVIRYHFKTEAYLADVLMRVWE